MRAIKTFRTTLTQNSKNDLFIIKIQNTYEIDYFQRMAYGASKALTENISLGQAFAEIKKIISINIVYFDLEQGVDYVYSGFTTFEGLHKKDTLQLSAKQKSTFSKEKISDIFPQYYIIKVNKFNDIAEDTLDEWIYFLKNSEVQDGFSAQGLAEAKDILDLMRLDKEQQYGYNRYLDYLHLKASELISMQAQSEELSAETEEKVRKDESYKRSVEIAKKLIKRKLSNEDIAEDTGLNLVQIEALRKEI